MRRLVVVLAVLFVLAIIAAFGLSILDQRIRVEAEQQAAERLGRELPIEGTPRVHIESFPFVLRVLNDGSVEQLEVSMRSLESNGVRVDEAKLTIEGLVLDRDALLDDHEIKLVSIEQARVDAWVSAEDLSRVAKLPVEIEEGEVSVTYRGKEYTGTAKVSKHAVLLLVDGVPPILSPLPSTDLLPCEPDLDIDGDRIHVACTVDEVPPAVAKVLAKRG
ncbi:MAG: LmeA family phospholipid-binding protein [Nannocystales bacterium]